MLKFLALIMLMPPYGERNEDTYKLGKVVVIWNRNLDTESPTEGIMLLRREERIFEVIHQAKGMGLDFHPLQDCLEAKQ